MTTSPALAEIRVGDVTADRTEAGIDVLHVEDYVFASSLARQIVDHAKQREFLDVMQHTDNRIRLACGYPPIPPLTERERAEGRLYRIGLHIRRHP